MLIFLQILSFYFPMTLSSNEHLFLLIEFWKKKIPIYYAYGCSSPKRFWRSGIYLLSVTAFITDLFYMLP